MQGQRLGDAALAGSTPEHPLLIQAGGGSGGGALLDYVSTGQLSLAAASAAAAPAGAPPAVRLGQQLADAAAALPPGAAAYYSLSPATGVNVSVWVCSPDAALQVSLFPGGGHATWCASRGPLQLGLAAPAVNLSRQASACCPACALPSCLVPPSDPDYLLARRLSSEPCAAKADGCTATSGGAGECSGLAGLLLPGLGNGPAHTVAVVAQHAQQAQQAAAPASARYEMRLLAVPLAPMFVSAD